MSFLAPFFLAGAAVVALPFLFHMIRRSSREKVKFSSLMFLRPSPPRLTKKSRLEHLILLLLRCAVIFLLAFAFSRPFVAKPVTNVPQAVEKNRVVILLDSSASMQREDLWARGKRSAARAMADLEITDAAALYLFDQQLRPVISFAEAAQLEPAQRNAETVARLDAAKPGWAGTHLGNALIGAMEQLVHASNQDHQEQGSSRSRIVLITDLQAGAKLDGLQGFEWPRNLDVEVVGLGGKNPSNAGLQILQPQQQLFFAGTNKPVRVRVQNSVGSKIEQFELQWNTEGRAVGAPMEIYVPSGQSRSFDAPRIPTGADSLKIVGDEVHFDNRVFYAAPSQHNTLVAYAGEDSGNDPNQALYYLRRAFEQTNVAVRVVALAGSNSIPASIDMLVLGSALTDRHLTVARESLDTGKTVFLPLHDTNTAAAVSALSGQAAIPVTEARVRNSAILGEISFNHPLFQPFSDARYSDFTKIHFWNYRKIDLAAVPAAQVLARFDSGDPALVELPVGKGRLLILAASWVPKESQLALSSKFVPLLFAMLEQSANIPSSSRQFAVGEPVPLPEAAAAGVTEVILPGGDKEPLVDGRFLRTERPGLYRAGDEIFAVNVEPAESRINPISADDLRILGVPMGVQADAPTAVTAARERHLLATDLENRQKLWRNFILAALAFVFLESWLSGRLSRAVAA